MLRKLTKQTNDKGQLTKESLGMIPPHPTQEEFDFQFPNRSQFLLPEWLESFLQTQPTSTHADTLSDPNAKFIVMTCYRFEQTQEEKCGGITDRMTLLPYYLWLAKKTGRKLLIKYFKPSPLENYLVPPQDGFDWRLPDGYFENELEAYANRTFQEFRDMRRMVWHEHIEKEPWNSSRVVFVNNNLAFPPILKRFTKLTGMVREEVWPGIFRRLFEPSPAVAKIVTSIVKQHGLVPGQYAGAHVRAKHPKGQGDIKLGKKRADKGGGGLNMKDERTKQIIQNITDNSVNCAVKIMPETKTVYFASDTNEPVDHLMTDSAWAPHFARGSNTTSLLSRKPSIITRPDGTKEPTHFDKEGGHHQVEDMYPTIVDLWILSHAKCIAQGVGGFGAFASLLTGNHDTCHIVHRNDAKGSLPCPWPDLPPLPR